MNELNEQASGAVNYASDMANNSLNSINSMMENPETVRTSMPGAPTQYLQSNNLVAKIAFLLGVVIVFVVLFMVGLQIVIYCVMPADNPVLINGVVEGHASIVIPQNPNNDTAITLKRSNNQSTGMEFTWSCWLNLGSADTSNGGIGHIFHKGVDDIPSSPTTTNVALSNGPGLYTYLTANNDLELVVVMNTFDTTTSKYTLSPFPDSDVIIKIGDVPIGLWFHVALRLENTRMDVYINGVVKETGVFTKSIPRQNYGDIFVATGVGFNGQLSTLQYYDYALGVSYLQWLYWWGPNLSLDPSFKLNTQNNVSNISNLWY